MSSSPAMRLLACSRSQACSGSASARNGSGPSRAITSSTCSGVTTSHTVAPRRSATTPEPARRRRTCPSGAGGPAYPSYAVTSKAPIRPRCTCRYCRRRTRRTGACPTPTPARSAAREPGRARGEPALGAGRLRGRAGEGGVERPCQAVQGVPFGHAGQLAFRLAVLLAAVLAGVSAAVLAGARLAGAFFAGAVAAAFFAAGAAWRPACGFVGCGRLGRLARRARSWPRRRSAAGPRAGRPPRRSRRWLGGLDPSPPSILASTSRRPRRRSRPRTRPGRSRRPGSRRACWPSSAPSRWRGRPRRGWRSPAERISSGHIIVCSTMIPSRTRSTAMVIRVRMETVTTAIRSASTSAWRSRAYGLAAAFSGSR